VKYTIDFKLEVIAYVLGGVGATTVAKHFGIPSETTVKTWVRLYQAHGEQSLYPRHKTIWTPAQKLRVLRRMWTEGWSINQTSTFFNIPSPSTVWTWQERYEACGFDGLKDRGRGRPPMKKPTISNQRGRPASDMTPEELREELEYLRAENAVLKKLEALLREKTARTKKKR